MNKSITRGTWEGLPDMIFDNFLITNSTNIVEISITSDSNKTFLQYSVIIVQFKKIGLGELIKGYTSTFWTKPMFRMKT